MGVVAPVRTCDMQRDRYIAGRLVSNRTDVRGAEDENKETVPVACGSCDHALVDTDPIYTIHGLLSVPGDAYVARLAVCKGCRKRKYRKRLTADAIHTLPNCLVAG